MRYAIVTHGSEVETYAEKLAVYGDSRGEAFRDQATAEGAAKRFHDASNGLVLVLAAERLSDRFLEPVSPGWALYWTQFQFGEAAPGSSGVYHLALCSDPACADALGRAMQAAGTALLYNVERIQKLDG